MSSSRSKHSDSSQNSGSAWLGELLGVTLPSEGSTAVLNGRSYTMRDRILRAGSDLAPEQEQTADVFGFKWSRRGTFEGEQAMARVDAWLVERYGDILQAAWWSEYGPRPLVLDAGCGAGMSGLAMFGPILDSVRYLGVDVSAAVEVARDRFNERGHGGMFMQASLDELPLAHGSVDVILAEGVLHHTASTELTLKTLATLLRPGGRFLFYVYRRKGPLREFTDDHVRRQLQAMSPDEAWDAVMPITRLGKALGDLDVEIEVPESIQLLEIPAGRYPLQRLFYWHVCKAFHHPELSPEELNHINYDWYGPAFAHRQTPEEVRRWCAEARLTIERENLQEAGITIVARRD